MNWWQNSERACTAIAPESTPPIPLNSLGGLMKWSSKPCPHHCRFHAHRLSQQPQTLAKYRSGQGCAEPTFTTGWFIRKDPARILPK